MANSKVVVLFSDGSGAALYFVHEGGAIDSDGDDHPGIPADAVWAYLPTGFEFWCEGLPDDDVVTLPAHVCPPLAPEKLRR